MQLDSFLLLLGTFTILLLFLQRTDPKRRLVVAIGLLLLLVLIVRYINYRNLHTEGQLAFIVALVLNGLFWLFIGRYNPVKSGDEIKVLGLDD